MDYYLTYLCIYLIPTTGLQINKTRDSHLENIDIVDSARFDRWCTGNGIHSLFLLNFIFKITLMENFLVHIADILPGGFLEVCWNSPE